MRAIAKTVNTVTGRVPVKEIGTTLTHEHMMYGFTGFNADVTLAPTNRTQIVTDGIRLMKDLKECGVKTFVDATPSDSGRNPEILREIAEKTGFNIVCSAGLYYEAEGGSAYWKLRSALGVDILTELYDTFMQEINVGIGGTDIKAGVIKVGTSKNMITDYETKVLTAAARASRDTGVPIITHIQEGTMGLQQAELFLAGGANPNNIMIGHMCDCTDLDAQIKVFEKGVYVGFDRMGIQGFVGCPQDTVRYDVIKGIVNKGYAHKLILSNDTINSWLGRPFAWPPALKEALVNWYPTHVFKHVLPDLKKKGISDAQLNAFVVENPQKLFAGE